MNDFDFDDSTKSAIGNVPAAAPKEAEKSEKEASKQGEASSSNPAPKLPGSADETMDQAWADEFLNKLNTEDPDMKKLMESFASAMNMGGAGPNGASSSSGSSVPLPNMPEMDLDSDEMKARIAELQKMLADVENGDDSEDALDKILEATGMSKMMEQLMSKEVLLEPFQEMDGQVRKMLNINLQFELTFSAFSSVYRTETYPPHTFPLLTTNCFLTVY